MRSLSRALMLSTASLLAASCGGGSSSSSPAPTPPSNQSVGGIWSGNLTSSGNGAISSTLVLVDEAGKYVAFAQEATNGCASVTVGTLASSGSTISGTGNTAIVSESVIPGISSGCTYPDGSTSATGTITGSIVQRSSITILLAATSAKGTNLGNESGTGTFDSRYNIPSSLTTIAGNWTDASGIAINISASGTLFFQDPASGCVVNGQISILNPTYNAYGVSATFASCAGVYSGLNGGTVSGLAAVDTNASPNKLYSGYTVLLNGAATYNAFTVATR